MSGAVLTNGVTGQALPSRHLIDEGETTKAQALAGAVSSLLGSVTDCANRDVVMGISYSSSMED